MQAFGVEKGVLDTSRNKKKFCLKVASVCVCVKLEKSTVLNKKYEVVLFCKENEQKESEHLLKSVGSSIVSIEFVTILFFVNTLLDELYT